MQVHGRARPAPYTDPMAHPPFVEQCLELLAPLGQIRARRMFGGHGIYCDDLFMALVALDRLYLKVDTQTQAAFQAAGCAPFVYDGKGQPITMSYWSAPVDAMEAPEAMRPWGLLALAAARRARLSAAARPAGRRRTRSTRQTP